MRRMNDDMVNGLSTNNNMAADLKMYITYVRSVPDGSGKTHCLQRSNTPSEDTEGNFPVIFVRQCCKFSFQFLASGQYHVEVKSSGYLPKLF